MFKKIFFALLILVLFFSHSSAFCAIITVDTKRDWMAQNFIANQIKGIGLVDSYQEDGENRSYVYDNALAAMACMAEGNFGLAKEILDTLANEVKNSSYGVPCESYFYSDTNGAGYGISYAGNSAWLLQALNIYQKLRSDKTYYKTQKKLADFLLSLQDSSDGGIKGSKDAAWKSTEHSIIAYCALRNFGKLNSKFSYIKRAEKIKTFLISSRIWNDSEKRFNQGIHADGNIDTGEVVDAQALGVLLLGSSYSGALTWAEENLKLSKTYNSQTVSGFDFDGNLDTVWLEGTLQMALSFYKSKNTSIGDTYYNEALKTAQSDGSLILATNEGSAGDSWILRPWRAIAPTSWLICYSLKFNPLILY